MGQPCGRPYAAVVTIRTDWYVLVLALLGFDTSVLRHRQDRGIFLCPGQQGQLAWCGPGVAGVWREQQNPKRVEHRLQARAEEFAKPESPNCRQHRAQLVSVVTMAHLDEPAVQLARNAFASLRTWGSF